MKTVTQSISALPFDRIARHPDIVLAVMVTAAVTMMIFPLPIFLVDVLLAVNLSLSAIILVSALLSEKTLSIPSFPSLLLLTTLFRLALNISTTRLILTTGQGGEVVEAFGSFVLGGDIVVGLVLFLVITLVQFLVIAKGAERVAEVGARFTLDAMPGKQMSIDAAVRSGAIKEEEAQEQRDELNRESTFYGAMDGAMKFIKGDAIAGLVITAINLIAGLALGVLRFNMSLGDAAERYCTLSVGDGLISQIPALLITLAAGVLTTRVGSKDKKASLGANLKTDLLANHKVLGIGSAFAFLLALLPGLPVIPFLTIAVSLALAAYARHNTAKHELAKSLASNAQITAMQQKIERQVKDAKAQRGVNDNLAPTVAPIGIDLSLELSVALGLGADNDGDGDLIGELIPQLRDALYLETGVRFPGVRVRSRVPGLDSTTVVYRIKDVPMLEETIDCDKLLAIESPQRLQRLGIEAIPAQHPLNSTTISLVPSRAKKALEAAGVQIWSPAGVVSLHLANLLRRNAKEFVGMHETSEMLERLEKVCPSLVREVVPKIISVAQLADILRRLVDEGLSIRDLKSILEALVQFGPYQTDTVLLTENVRAALSNQIAHALVGLSGRLPVVLLDGMIEDTVRAAITQTAGGSYLALDPEVRRAMLVAIERTVRPVVLRGIRPAILTCAEIRRYVRKLIEEEMPETSVLSFQELPPKLTVHPLGRALLREELAA